MKPSRIVKSAWQRAVKAGFKGSLKQWARFQTNNVLSDHAHACVQWQAGKDKQRKRSVTRRANAGHGDVHATSDVRSTRHSNGSNLGLRGEVRDREPMRTGTHGGGHS